MTKEERKAYYEANRDKLLAKQKAYKESNREKLAARDKAYREANREGHKAWRESNRDKLLAKQKAYREAKREKIAARDKAYKESNREKILAKKKKYREANREKLAVNNKDYHEANREKRLAKQKVYREANREKLAAGQRAWKNIRMKNDPLFRFKRNTRNCILVALKRGNYTKHSKTFEILGCNFETFCTHIERQFAPGMTFENHGLWHLDHKTPLAMATNESEVIKLNHFTNFQPLWAADNLSKGAKLPHEHQLQLTL